jgi:hypothetical protein
MHGIIKSSDDPTQYGCLSQTRQIALKESIEWSKSFNTLRYTRTPRYKKTPWQQYNEVILHTYVFSFDQLFLS